MATIKSKSGQRYRVFKSIPRGLVEPNHWRDVRPGVSHPLAMAGRGRPLFAASDFYNWVPAERVVESAVTIRRSIEARAERIRRLADTTPGCPNQAIKVAIAAGFVRLHPSHYGG